MKSRPLNTLLFISILFLSCEVFTPYVDECGVTDGDNSSCIEGCTDTNACNFVVNAVIDDGSCIYLDCTGECGGSDVGDCAGECNGSCQTSLENSGDYVCGGDASNSNNCLFTFADDGSIIQFSYTWSNYGNANSGTDYWVNIYMNIDNIGTTTIYGLYLYFRVHSIAGETDGDFLNLSGIQIPPGSSQSFNLSQELFVHTNNTKTKLEFKKDVVYNSITGH